MKGKLRVTMGKKIMAMIIAMAVTLCGTALFVSYRTYRGRTTEFYVQLAHNAAATLASQLTPEELDHYYETLEMDDRYYEIQNFIADLVANNNVEYLYVVRPHGIGVTFLFDSDMEAGENGDYTSGGYCALGTYVDLAGEFAENLDRLLDGEEVSPIVQKDPSYGWLMTAMAPVCYEDGSMAGYVMADVSMNAVVQEQQHFLLYSGSLLAALTLVFAAAYLVVIRRSFIQPVQQLTQAALKYEGGEGNKVFRQVEIRNNDELKSLADAFRMMLVEINLNSVEQQELAVREQRLESELQLAKELNVSLLPKALPQRSGGYPFEVQGNLEQGQELSCCFYDYFLMDGERLCVLLGEVPGHGTPQVIYTVMAQATIKSQMRSGQTLAAAIAAANQQLYEVGGGLSIQVMAGVLEWNTGCFSYINAGQRPLLLMRSQEYYEWGRTLSYAPLGQSENVLYRVEELKLRQGDRLFFHTRGLSEIRDRSGVPFSQEQLRIALNEKQNRLGDLNSQLHSLKAAAGAYAGRSSAIEGYAILALEYRRRDKAQAHCLLTPNAAGSAALADFLRGQFEINGVSKGQAAQLIVLSDELFTLCCRRAPRDGRIMAECAMPPGEDLTILRLRGDFGGISPLEQLEDEAAEHAAAFITNHCDRTLFEHTESVDNITVLKRLALGTRSKEGILYEAKSEVFPGEETDDPDRAAERNAEPGGHRGELLDL